jgi:hypothetical protein
MDYPKYVTSEEILNACRGGFFCYVAMLFLVVFTVDAIRSLHEQGWSLRHCYPAPRSFFLLLVLRVIQFGRLRARRAAAGMSGATPNDGLRRHSSKRAL